MPMHIKDVEAAHSKWWLFLLLGAALVLLAVLAFSDMYFVTDVFVMYLGFVFLIAGVFHVAVAFAHRIGSGFFLHLLPGLLDLLLGIFMLAFTDAAAGALTIYLVLLFVIGGLMRAPWPRTFQPPRWGLSLVSAGIGIAVGLIILADYQESRNWVIGLFVAVELLRAVSRGFSHRWRCGMRRWRCSAYFACRRSSNFFRSAPGFSLIPGCAGIASRFSCNFSRSSVSFSAMSRIGLLSAGPHRRSQAVKGCGFSWRVTGGVPLTDMA